MREDEHNKREIKIENDCSDMVKGFSESEEEKDWGKEGQKETSE
ncbi:hypothetical protein [Cytobacillus stercorigallinarum]|nr:hypothetical protein [Cytobacillus stercorigallinarum]